MYLFKNAYAFYAADGKYIECAEVLQSGTASLKGLKARKCVR